MPADEEETVEDKIYEEQFELIKKEHGEHAANHANYGWGVIENEDDVDVATKVYGHGVLRSVGNYETGEIKHEWV